MATRRRRVRGALTDSAGALEAVERILNRGGEPQDVLRAVLDALRDRGVRSATIRRAGGDELCVGDGSPGLRAPVVVGGERIGELEATADDAAFVERIATLISPYVHASGEAAGTARTS